MADSPERNPTRQKTIQQIARGTGAYPVEAFQFVQMGLARTVERLHGNVEGPDPSHHITGQELCQGLRELALERWGLLARVVLARWNINSTLDFGRIVFAMVDHGILSKTERDSLEDFRQVYSFRSAFERGYRIEGRP